MCQIHCFEPSQHTHEALSRTITEANPPKKCHVVLNQHALGRKRETLTLHYDELQSGLASLTKRRLDHFNINMSKSEEVEVLPLDEYCALNHISHIHLLKIDDEGHELDVLGGALDMLKNQAIDIITFEFGGCNIDTRTYFQDFWYFFKDYDMEIFRILPSGELLPIKAYKEIYEQFITTNYVAMKSSIARELGLGF